MANKEKEDFFASGPGEGIDVNTVEAPGIITDAAGNKWTIPEADETDFMYRSVFDIPKRDPRFHYQFEEEKDVSMMMAEGFRPCTRAELGIPEFTPIAEYGRTIDSYHRVGTQVCLKTLKQIADRKYKGLKSVCDAAMSATEPQALPGHEDTRERAKLDVKGGYDRKNRRYEMTRRVEIAKPKNPENESVKGATV